MGKQADKPTIEDLADWFLAKEPMTHKKLQKLCYYAVAWGYALMGKQIVEDDEFQAWVHGPVSPKLYQKYKTNGWNTIKSNKPAPEFDEDVKELLESVWATYGDQSGNALEALSHSEKPWREARLDLRDDETGQVVISPESMKVFYSSIYTGDAK